MSIKPQYRYPGIRSFESAEQELFFGRSEEIRSLYAQVSTLNLVVLFSKSGIGKSSLLNAGLVPLLELEPYIPIKVRLQDTSFSPVASVKNALRPYMDEAALQRHTGGTLAEAGFWESLRACRFERYGEPAVPVFLFDQFEEFFEHPPEDRRAFIVDLADLVSGRLPNRVGEHLLSIPPEKRTPEDMAWHQPVQNKVVMAIRSDRLSLLDELSVEIPLILHNRFQLKPLQRHQASEAITEPAQLPGAGFATPPFSYRKETLGLILDELTNKNQEIESFQLQLVSRHIEQQVQQRKRGTKGESVEIDDTYVNSREDIQSVINDYYEQAIDDLPDELEERARIFIETGLIVGGRRVGITEGVEKEKFGIDEDLLRMLVDSRLIRVENTHLGRSYEVSHDALVEPILKSYEKRRVQQEKEDAIKVQQEQAARLKEELEQQARQQQLIQARRSKRLTLAFAIVAGTLALTASAAWVEARRQYEEVQRQISISDYNFNQARENLVKYQEAELKLLSTKIDVYMTANQPLLAKKELEQARKNSIWSAEMDKKEAEVSQLLQKLQTQ
ncbi:MAG TPA: hypothetical protein PK228_08170 [Saprospiraceae bacterium]|nr:hypothetical protein [Saprospiraceae bacterium]